MENEGKLAFSNYLKRMFVEVFSPRYFQQHGESPDEHDFAVFLGLSDQAFSQYKLGKRRPTIKVVEQIADKLHDASAYDAAGYPRHMPKSPFLVYVVDSDPYLTKEDRDEIQRIIQERLEEKNERRKKSNRSAIA